jgi:hypothetical protein
MGFGTGFRGDIFHFDEFDQVQNHDGIPVVVVIGDVRRFAVRGYRNLPGFCARADGTETLVCLRIDEIDPVGFPVCDENDGVLECKKWLRYGARGYKCQQ